MKLHSNARTCPHCRSLIVTRVLEDQQLPSKVATDFRVSHRTVHKWIRRYQAEGMDGLKDKTSAPHTVPRKLVQPGKELNNAVMALLHTPPSQSGFNRTTWRMVDLKDVLAERGMVTTQNSIRTVIKRAGVRWRQARISLTSTDPDYREKLAAIKGVLANFRDDEAFFSIDELGPVAVKMRGGRSLQRAGDVRTVPQWQMARAVLHNSDYATVEDAHAAVAHYLEDRNVAFLKDPRRAGKSIWLAERVPSKFEESNNCKDPWLR